MNDQPPSTPPAPSLIRSAFVILGLLLMGAGVCCGVFCYRTFWEAHQLERSAEAARAQVRNLEKEAPEKKAAMNYVGWQEVVRQDELSTLRKTVVANELLAVSIGLFLGGTTAGLLGRRSTKVFTIAAPGNAAKESAPDLPAT